MRELKYGMLLPGDRAEDEGEGHARGRADQLSVDRDEERRDRKRETTQGGFLCLQQAMPGADMEDVAPRPRPKQVSKSTTDSPCIRGTAAFPFPAARASVLRNVRYLHSLC